MKELVPYHTESDRPGPPATIHGNTLTFEGATMTCTGLAHCVQLVAALATVVNTWYALVVPLAVPFTAKGTWRLRPESREVTGKSRSGSPARPLATVINPAPVGQLKG